MPNIAHELFLLSTNLSQFKCKELVTKVFIESINTLFLNQDFKWIEPDIVPEGIFIDVCTRAKTYGYIQFNKKENFTNETFSLLQNSVQLLGIYLEKLEQELLLKNQKEHLKYLVDEKTKQLHNSQKELEIQKEEIERQNETLKERNDFIQTVLDNLPIGLAANKIDSNYAFYSNKKLEEIYGWPKSEINLIESFFEKVYPNPGYRKKIMSQIISDIKSGDPARMHWENIIITTSNGAKKYVNAVNIPLFDQNTMISTVIDVTDLYKTQIELTKAKEKAEEANRLKTEFLNNMSHEVRTPMNGIIGFSEMLENRDITEEQRNFYAKIIQNSSLQLLRIIDDILEISTIETRQLSINEGPFFLNDLIMELFAVFNLKSKDRNIPLYIKKGLRDDQSEIISDESKLKKILDNLIENALKFTFSGFVEFGYYIEENKLKIYVTDTGIGISPENFELIFDRFSQEEKEISRKQGGLGLGLSISLENAKLLGGDITVKSEKGKGSTFLVTIPFKPVHADNININNHINKEEDEYVILIAEDEEVNYLYLEALFHRKATKNFKLIHTKNGKETVDICKTNKNIDMILMDIKMPEMNGFEATEIIKSECPDMPIIAQTAYSTEADRKLAFKHGCDGYISKPLNPQKLFGLVNKYLKKHPIH